MNRKDVHKRLIASESLWFGGVRDVPKVYQTGTRHHVEPILSSSSETHGDEDVAVPDCYEYSVDLATGELAVHDASVE